MDAFENVMALLLRRHGCWTATSVKVELTKEQKVAIGRPSSPRWEIDLLAYKGSPRLARLFWVLLPNNRLRVVPARVIRG
jgi:hypothetical protein